MSNKKNTNMIEYKFSDVLTEIEEKSKEKVDYQTPQFKKYLRSILFLGSIVFLVISFLSFFNIVELSSQILKFTESSWSSSSFSFIAFSSSVVFFYGFLKYKKSK